MSKKLFVYFSHKGENYSKGKIVNLEKGNTEIVAEMISNILNVDIFADFKYFFFFHGRILKKTFSKN